jgi:hypothetical protein
VQYSDCLGTEGFSWRADVSDSEASSEDAEIVLEELRAQLSGYGWHVELKVGPKLNMFEFSHPLTNDFSFGVWRHNSGIVREKVFEFVNDNAEIAIMREQDQPQEHVELIASIRKCSMSWPSGQQIVADLAYVLRDCQIISTGEADWLAGAGPIDIGLSFT